MSTLRFGNRWFRPCGNDAEYVFGEKDNVSDTEMQFEERKKRK